LIEKSKTIKILKMLKEIRLLTTYIIEAAMVRMERKKNRT